MDKKRYINDTTLVCCPINIFTEKQFLIKHTEGVWGRNFPMSGGCSAKRLRRSFSHRESVVSQKYNKRNLSDTTLVIVLDGGATSIKALIIDLEGNVLGKGTGGPSNHLLTELDVVEKSIKDAIHSALNDSGLKSEDIKFLCGGTAGVDFDGKGNRPIIKIVKHLLPFTKKVLITGDMVISHYGALLHNPGITVIAGTGSVVFGINSQGKRVKIGGWGPLFGNEGSADFIARQGLNEASKYYDGRREKTIIKEEIEKYFNIKGFRKIIDVIYGKRLSIEKIAELSKVVESAAKKGDRIAIEIFKNAGHQLAEGICAAIKKLHMEHDEVKISYQGSVFDAGSFILEPMKEKVLEKFNRAVVIPPHFPPVIGSFFFFMETFHKNLNEKILRNLKNSYSIINENIFNFNTFLPPHLNPLP
ncbi:MAG: BadF/BadG/BcrA/BcrD ATPase family protein [Acidobacteriota bacterium]